MIVVRTDMKWPCAIVKEEDVPREGAVERGLAKRMHAVERLELLLEGCDSVDAIHNALDDNGIVYEPIDDVATAEL
jgi:hypothetical protein